MAEQIAVAAVDLHVVEQGEGPPVLLLHGFAANAFTWAKIRAPLSMRNTVYAVDLKGFGDSPKPDDGAYTLRDHADAVLRLIERRNLTDLAIVGHSMGGGVAMLVALELQRRAGIRLRGLVLIGSIGASQPIPRMLVMLRLPLAGELIAWGVPPRTFIRAGMRSAYFDPRRIEPAFVEAYAAPLRTRAGRRAALATVRQTAPSDVDALFRRAGEIRAPVLLLWGHEDRVVPLSAGERLEAAIPGARLVVLARCGHIPQEEAPEATLAVLRGAL